MSKPYSSILIICLIIFVSMVFLTNNLNASPLSYRPGVKTGDSAVYNVLDASYESNLPFLGATPPVSEFIGVNSVNSTVQSVDGQLVTLQQVRSLKNSTIPLTTTVSGNVSSGAGTLEYWLIAGGLVKDDRVDQSPTNPFLPSPTINDTTEKVYAGNVRQVNIVNLTMVYPPVGTPSSPYSAITKLYATYDQQTGLLMEIIFKQNVTIQNSQYDNQNLHVLIASTNLWTGPVGPAFLVVANSTSIVIGQNSATNIQLVVYSINYFSGTVSFQVTVSAQGPTATVTPTQVTVPTDGSAVALLSVTGHDTPIGNYSLNLTSTGGSLVVRSPIGVMVQPADFTFEIAHGTLTVALGVSNLNSAVLRPVAGFNQPIKLTSKTNPTGLAVTFPTGSTVTFFGTTGSLVYIRVGAATNSTVGIYQVTVNATGGGKLHSVQFMVNVVKEYPVFNITASQNQLVVGRGGMTTDSLAIHPLEGLSQMLPGIPTVSLSVAVTPQSVNGLQASVTPSFTQVFIGPTMQTVMLTVTAPSSANVGTYNVTVTATMSGGPTRYVSVIVTVQAQSVNAFYTLSLDPTSQTIPPGSTKTVTVQVGSGNNFNDDVHFTATSSQPGLTVTLDKSSVHLQPGATSTTLTLTIKAANDLKPNTYTVTVTGNSSSKTETVDETVNVQGNPQGAASNPSIFGINGPLLYAIIGGIVAAIAIVLGMILYRSRSHATVISPPTTPSPSTAPSP